MTVTGMTIYPTPARVTAPAIRFAKGDSCGNEELCFAAPLCAARLLRTPFSVLKYMAEPTPERIVDGNVPRHSCRIGDGPVAIERTVLRSVAVAEEDGGCCWIRVFNRSAGCRIIAERSPEVPPERKCDLLFFLGAVEGEEAVVVVVVETGAAICAGIGDDVVAGSGLFVYSVEWRWIKSATGEVS
jgi:hypothetical protein